MKDNADIVWINLIVQVCGLYSYYSMFALCTGLCTGYLFTSLVQFSYFYSGLSNQCHHKDH